MDAGNFHDFQIANNKAKVFRPVARPAGGGGQNFKMKFFGVGASWGGRTGKSGQNIYSRRKFFQKKVILTKFSEFCRAGMAKAPLAPPRYGPVIAVDGTCCVKSVIICFSRRKWMSCCLCDAEVLVFWTYSLNLYRKYRQTRKIWPQRLIHMPYWNLNLITYACLLSEIYSNL